MVACECESHSAGPSRAISGGWGQSDGDRRVGGVYPKANQAVRRISPYLLPTEVRAHPYSGPRCLESGMPPLNGSYVSISPVSVVFEYLAA